MTTSKQIEMRDKLEALFNEQRLRNAQRTDAPSTFSQFANSEANSVRGRFAPHETFAVTGSTPAVHYPQLPSSSPWADRPPDEPPLGWDVNALEPVGEAFEVANSLEELGV